MFMWRWNRVCQPFVTQVTDGDCSLVKLFFLIQYHRGESFGALVVINDVPFPSFFRMDRLAANSNESTPRPGPISRG
jgi:hypothetical protein